MICSKHNVEMPVVKPATPGRCGRMADLHRCPVCTKEFQAAVAASILNRQHGYNRKRQIVLPPVVMSERWP